MSDPLDAELDALFQQPPAAHVEARNALAERLRKAGNRADAERIKKLKRPAVAAWAINLLHFRQPALLEAARAAASALLSVHARDGVGPSDLASAVTTQRRAVQAALDAAVRGAADAGVVISSPDQRKLETTLQAWLAGAGDEVPGRMTHELEASGWQAVTAVGEAGPRKPQAAEPVPSAADVPAPPELRLVAAVPRAPVPDPARVARARLHVQNHERAVDTAQKHLSHLRDELNAEARELERGRVRVQEAEQALRALMARVVQQQAALTAKQALSASAEAVLHEAERALSDARAELDQI